MKKLLLALSLLVSAHAFAQQANPFMRPKQGTAPSAATTPAGLPGALPPNVPPVPGSPATPVAAPAVEEPKPEVQVRYSGRVNELNIYKSESGYHFDKKRRERPVMVEVEGGASLPVAASDKK